jgi:hypothetical protein
MIQPLFQFLHHFGRGSFLGAEKSGRPVVPQKGELDVDQARDVHALEVLPDGFQVDGLDQGQVLAGQTDGRKGGLGLEDGTHRLKETDAPIDGGASSQADAQVLDPVFFHGLHRQFAHAITGGLQGIALLGGQPEKTGGLGHFNHARFLLGKLGDAQLGLLGAHEGVIDGGGNDFSLEEVNDGGQGSFTSVGDGTKAQLGFGNLFLDEIA